MYLYDDILKVFFHNARVGGGDEQIYYKRHTSYIYQLVVHSKCYTLTKKFHVCVISQWTPANIW